MSYEIEVKDLAEQPVMTVRTRTSMANIKNDIGQGFGEIFGYLAESGAECTGAPMAIYHGPDFSDENIDLEVAVPVREIREDKERVRGSVMPAGRAVTTMHVGPYSDIPAAYQAVMDYVNENGLKAGSSMWEVYLSNPETTLDHSKLQTEVVWPVVE